MNKQAVVAHHEPHTSDIVTYTLGFFLSLILTVIAYLVVTHHSLHHRTLLATIIVLAMVQFTVQAIFFLHVGVESRPKLKLLAFVFMFGTVATLVIGSLWIMDNLNYHMMTPQEERSYLHDHEGL